MLVTNNKHILKKMNVRCNIGDKTILFMIFYPTIANVDDMVLYLTQIIVAVSDIFYGYLFYFELIKWIEYLNDIILTSKFGAQCYIQYKNSRALKLPATITYKPGVQLIAIC